MASEPVKVSQPTEYCYTLKLINPLRMSEYKNLEIQSKGRCKSISELKEFISDNHPSGIDGPNLNEVEMGYIEPGHGGKGRKVWIYDEKDVDKMYEAYANKKRVLLWCYSQPTIQKKSTDSQAKSDKVITTSGYLSQVNKQEEISAIYAQLKEKHEGKYKTEQLNTWAHMLYLKTHDSFDNPLNKPFFTRKRPVSPENTSTVSKRVISGGSISPSRRVNMRSELIDQLKKCQDLIDSGAISKEMFDELQLTIFTDIKKL